MQTNSISDDARDSDDDGGPSEVAVGLEALLDDTLDLDDGDEQEGDEDHADSAPIDDAIDDV